MKLNKIETAIQWFRMSLVVFAKFTGHRNSIYNKNTLKMYIQCSMFKLNNFTNLNSIQIKTNLFFNEGYILPSVVYAHCIHT